MRRGTGRVLALALCAWMLAGAEAPARCLALGEAPAAQDGAAQNGAAWGDARRDRLGRVVALVRVNGQGPFRFIVDTGANRSVISGRLAERLGLAPHGAGAVHTVHDVTMAPLVRVEALQYGDLDLGGADMPMLDGPVLAGEEGLLGVDGMGGRRLLIDFERRCVEIAPAERARRLRDWISVRGEMRFGNLMVVRGVINGLGVNLLLDSGAQNTLANVALRDALEARYPMARAPVSPARAISAGEPVILDEAVFVPAIMLEDVRLDRVTAFVGDFHIFQLWNMIDEPTLLIGMDVLAHARGMAIDYRRGIVYFNTGGGGARGRGLRR